MSDRQHLVLLVVAVAGVYANSLGGSFHYDDFHSIVDNPHIRSLAHAGDFFTGTAAFSSDPAKGMYRPVLLLTYAVNYALGGADAAGYLLVNALLHGATALVLWSLARAIGLARPWAALAALVFAVHPLGAEPVNYVSSRSELLAGLLYLASVRLYVGRGPRARVLSVVCFGLGLLSKSVVATLPAALALYDWLTVRRLQVRRLAPYGAVVALYGLALVLTGFARASAAAAPRGLEAQLWTQIKAVPFYLGLVCMPVRLNVEHQFAVSEAPSAAVLLGAALLGSLAWVGLRHRISGIRYWVLWPVLLSLPAAVVPLNVLVNERRLYLPVAGLCILLAHLLARRPLPRWGGAATAAAVLALAGLTVQRNALWADEYTLWADAAGKSPYMPRAHVHLGNALRARGDARAAAAAYARAVEVDPHHRPARTNLASLLYERARTPAVGETERRDLLERAASQYRAVLAQDPSYREALSNLGSVYLDLGRRAEAEALYRRAVLADPNFGDGHYNLGRLHLDGGDPAAAELSLARAARLQPERADGHFLLGNARALQGKLPLAAPAYRRACDLDPGEAAHCYNLGEVLLSLARSASAENGSTGAAGLLAEAGGAYRRALAATPGYRRGRERLSEIARLQGQGSR